MPHTNQALIQAELVVVQDVYKRQILHSNNKAHVEYAAVRLPVSRIGVNLVGSSGLGGGFDCGLNPTATLGCGTWGNNSISENLWWHHLVNISRIAYQMPNNPVPTDEEIWAE